MLLSIICTLLYCLTATLILELIFALVMGVRGRDLRLVVLVNVLTNPVVAFTYGYLCRGTPWEMPAMVFLEAGAVIAEAICYRRYATTIKRAWLFSLGANAFSLAIGEVINFLVQ